VDARLLEALADDVLLDLVEPVGAPADGGELLLPRPVRLHQPERLVDVADRPPLAVLVDELDRVRVVRVDPQRQLLGAARARPGRRRSRSR
jgi:hypothetical protein